MKKNYLFIALCLLAGTIASCSDDDNGPSWKELFDKEQALIKEFVKDKTPQTVFPYQITFGGEVLEDYAYVFNYDEDASKTRPKDGQFILVNYIQRNLDRSAILDATYLANINGSKLEGTALYPMGGPIYESLAPASESIDIFSECMKYIPEGTSGEIILSSIMTQNTYMYREYKVEKIIEGSLLDYEYELMDKFLEAKGFERKNSIQVPSEILSDTITKIVKISEVPGAPILATDSVTVHCNGYILDEFSDNFNENKLRAVLKMDDEEKVTWKVSDLIEGLRMGLTYMNVKEKAYILIPSGRAYGKGVLKSYYNLQYVMPPYATLVYEIEIFDRKPNAK